MAGPVDVLYRSGTAGIRCVVRGGQEAAQTAAPLGTTLGPADLGIACPVFTKHLLISFESPNKYTRGLDPCNYYSHVTDELLKEWNRQLKISLTQVRIPPLPLSVLRQVAKLLTASSIGIMLALSPRGCVVG